MTICIYCGSHRTTIHSRRTTKLGEERVRYLCKDCKKTQTPGNVIKQVEQVKPRLNKDPAEVYNSDRPRKHCLIPDTQVKPGLDLSYLEAMGNYIADKEPDVLVHIGDHWDMPSLSVYDKGLLKGQGRNVQEDIRAGIEGMEALMKPIKNKPGYNPDLHFCIGNHEERIMRHVQANPELDGFLSYANFELDTWGWRVHDFLKPVIIDGVAYAHYFTNPNTGKPLGGMMSTRLKSVGRSFTMGHQQGFDYAARYLPTGEIHMGMVAGSCYSHDEDYKGYQGNNHFRGLIIKHQVHNGYYDLMQVSLDYIMDKYL